MVINIDIADRKLVGMSCGVAGYLSHLPLQTRIVDVCVLRLLVVNYVRDCPRRSVELGRVVSPAEPESSNSRTFRSLEYSHPAFRRDVPRRSHVSTSRAREHLVYGTTICSASWPQVGYGGGGQPRSLRCAADSRLRTEHPQGREVHRWLDRCGLAPVSSRMRRTSSISSACTEQFAENGGPA